MKGIQNPTGTVQNTGRQQKTRESREQARDVTTPIRTRERDNKTQVKSIKSGWKKKVKTHKAT